MRSLVFLLAFLVGCASHGERKKDLDFIVDTPVGQVKGKVRVHETTETKTGLDQEQVRDLLGEASEVARSILLPGGAVGLGLAWLLGNRKRKAAEAAADLARETVSRMTTSIEKFKDSAGEAANPLLDELSSQMDKPHKMLVREIKP